MAPMIQNLNRDSAIKMKASAFKPKDIHTLGMSSGSGFASPNETSFMEIDTRDASKMTLEQKKLMESQTTRHARNRTIDLPHRSVDQSSVTPRVVKLSRFDHGKSAQGGATFKSRKFT